MKKPIYVHIAVSGEIVSVATTETIYDYIKRLQEISKKQSQLINRLIASMSDAVRT